MTWIEVGPYSLEKCAQYRWVRPHHCALELWCEYRASPCDLLSIFSKILSADIFLLVVESGIVALTLETSGVVFASVDEPIIEPEGCLHAFCHALPGKWHLMGVMLSAGGSLRWFRDTFARGVDFSNLIESTASTRHVPLIFVGGDREKVKRIKNALPDATYTKWDEIQHSLQYAIENLLSDPVTPESEFDVYKGLLCKRNSV